MEKAGKMKDPKIQALKDKKKGWFQAMKEFRKRLGAASRGISGRGSLPYGIPATQITEPAAPEVGAFLSELASNFQQLIDAASQIMQEQSQIAQSHLPKTETLKVATASAKTPHLLIADKTLPTLLAITAEEQERGLMGVAWPPPVMSFIYSSPQINRFWMHSTPSPLDIVFSMNGKITAIHKGEPYSTRLIGDYAPSDLVVELPYGSCRELGVKVGDPIKLI